jgi:hypothetical protein
MKRNRNLFDVGETDHTIKGQLLWIYIHSRLLVSLALRPVLERFAALEIPRRYLPLAAGGLIGALTHENLVATWDDASHDHTWIPTVRQAAVLTKISLTTACCDRASADGAPAMRAIFHSLLGSALAKGRNVRADRLGGKKKRCDTDCPTDGDYGRKRVAH